MGRSFPSIPGDAARLRAMAANKARLASRLRPENAVMEMMVGAAPRSSKSSWHAHVGFCCRSCPES